MSYFANSSSLERLFGLLFGCGGERSSETPPGVPRPFTAISISGSSSEESTSINVLDAAMPATDMKQISEKGLYDLPVVIKGAIRYGNTPKQIYYGIINT